MPNLFSREATIRHFIQLAAGVDANYSFISERGDIAVLPKKDDHEELR